MKNAEPWHESWAKLSILSYAGDRPPCGAADEHRLFASAASQSTSKHTAPYSTELNHHTNGTLKRKCTVLATELQRTTHCTSTFSVVLKLFYGTYCKFTVGVYRTMKTKVLIWNTQELMPLARTWCHFVVMVHATCTSPIILKLATDVYSLLLAASVPRLTVFLIDVRSCDCVVNVTQRSTPQVPNLKSM